MEFAAIHPRNASRPLEWKSTGHLILEIPAKPAQTDNRLLKKQVTHQTRVPVIGV